MVCLFSKGDKVVYPLYGAGVIEDLEHGEAQGAPEMFYVLDIPVSNLKIKISAAKAESGGIRKAYPKEKVLDILRKSAGMTVAMSDNWSLRYKENFEKIKSGSLHDVAVVFRALLKREKTRSLSSAEKKMLTQAKQIIISEIAVSQNIERNMAEEILFEAVAE